MIDLILLYTLFLYTLNINSKNFYMEATIYVNLFDPPNDLIIIEFRYEVNWKNIKVIEIMDESLFRIKIIYFTLFRGLFRVGK